MPRLKLTKKDLIAEFAQVMAGQGQGSPVFIDGRGNSNRSRLLQQLKALATKGYTSAREQGK